MNNHRNKWNNLLQKFNTKGIDAIAIITVIIILILLILLNFNSIYRVLINPFINIQTPTTIPTLTTTPTQTPTRFPETATLTLRPGDCCRDLYETTDPESSGYYDIDPDIVRIGMLEFEYPPVITVRNSETVVLQAYIPLELASADSSDFDRIIVSRTSLGVISNLVQYNKLTALYPYMRAEMQSISFEIKPLQNSDDPKYVDVIAPGNRTSWAWIIQAPEYPGQFALAISVYFLRNPNPSWVGSLIIQVVPLTDTPAPTPSNTLKPTITPSLTPMPTPTTIQTPVPLHTRIYNSIIDNMSLGDIPVISAIIGFIVTIFIPKTRKWLMEKNSHIWTLISRRNRNKNPSSDSPDGKPSNRSKQ
jgi:hypothetical protein